MTGELPDEAVSLSLTADEALVLFDLLSRVIDDRDGVELRGVVEHDAELWVLNRVLGRLERELATPFRTDYCMLLDMARARVAETSGGRWPWRDEEA